MLELGQIWKRQSAIPFAYSLPADTYSDLARLDRRLTSLMQTLLHLKLTHSDKQDIESQPFNWPLVKAIAAERMSIEFFRCDGLPESDAVEATYPSRLISELQDFRDAVRLAKKSVKPKRGNDPTRSVKTQRIAEVAKNFVFRYRAQFGHMPPISKTGWVVELLSRVLNAAGIDDVDASDVLRRYVERDVVGRSVVPSASKARCRKRRVRPPKTG